MKGVRTERTLDRKDKLDVLVLTGKRVESFDKSSISKVIQYLSVCSSDFEVIGSNFHTDHKRGKNESKDESKIQ